MPYKNISLFYFVLCIFLTYIYIYAPAFQFIPFGLDKLVMVFSYFYITIKREWSLLFIKFKNELIILLTIFSYSFVISCINLSDPIVAMYDFLLLTQVIPCSYALSRFIENKQSVPADKILIICAVVASLISTYLIFNPETAYYFKSELLKYPEELVDKFYFRGYGLSDGLLFSYPVIQGFCLSFILLGFVNNKIYYISILPILISIFTNARSGFVPIFLSVFIIFLIDKVRFIKFMGVAIVLILVCITFFINISDNNFMLKAAVEWGMTTIDIVGDLFYGRKTDNFEIIFDQMLIFPENIAEWIIGSGKFIFTGFEKTTDIGYLLRLNYGGFLYLTLFIILSIIMYIRLSIFNKILSLIIFLSVIYLNFKGDFFIVNPGSRFLFFVYVICILNNDLLKNIDYFYNKKIIKYNK